MSRRAWELAEALSRGFLSLLQRAPSPEELQAFSRYLSLLLEWNRAHHLTGYRTAPEITEKLLLDSLLFLRWMKPGAWRVLDLGAGAGIPGIPMRVVEPRIKLTLIEARRRWSSFLAVAVRELGLEGAQVESGRAEELLASEPALRGGFDIVVTRAAGPIRSILPLALDFLTPGGRLISSGPPAGKPPPSLPAGIAHRWESVPAGSKAVSRRFLIVEKS